MSISFQKLPIRIGVELLINEGTLSFDGNCTTCSSIFEIEKYILNNHLQSFKVVLKECLLNNNRGATSAVWTTFHAEKVSL